MKKPKINLGFWLIAIIGFLCWKKLFGDWDESWFTVSCIIFIIITFYSIDQAMTYDRDNFINKQDDYYRQLVDLSNKLEKLENDIYYTVKNVERDIGIIRNDILDIQGKGKMTLCDIDFINNDVKRIKEKLSETENDIEGMKTSR